MNPLLGVGKTGSKLLPRDEANGGQNVSDINDDTSVNSPDRTTLTSDAGTLRPSTFPPTLTVPPASLANSNNVSIDFSAFCDRVGAEHHDAMKVVPSIQLLLIDLQEELETAGFESNAFESLDGAITSYARRSEAFCRWVDLIAGRIKDERTDLQEEFNDVFTSAIYLAMAGSFLRFRDNLRKLNDELASVVKPSERIVNSIATCSRLDDNAEIILRFMNMIRKFDLGYKGDPTLVDINDSIRDALGYFPTDKVVHYLAIDTVEQFDSNRQNLPKALIDPDILFKVWLNLATNACEECEKFRLTGVSFKISARQDGNYIEVRAEDKGPGIDPGVAANPNMILERGFSTKTGKNNRGLGMDIIKQIVEEAGGTIRVESKFGIPDSGATIIIRLPVAPEN